MLTVESLARSFDRRPVVREVSFHVPRGHMMALLGPNGCGKSTTMKMLAGAIRPSAGTFTVAGQPGGSEAARRSTGYVPDTRGLFPRLTCREHLELALTLHGQAKKDDRVEPLLERLNLTSAASLPAGVLSHGQSRRLSLAVALVASPPLLLIDEPFDGVDPLGVDVITAMLDEERARGASIVLTTHLLDAAAVSDSAALFNGGVLAGPWPVSELIAEHGTLKAAWEARAAS